jgi:hypothetical protein
VNARVRDATRPAHVDNPWYAHAGVHAYVGQDIYWRAKLEITPITWVQRINGRDVERTWYGDAYPDQGYHWLRCSV